MLKGLKIESISPEIIETVVSALDKGMLVVRKKTYEPGIQYFIYKSEHEADPVFVALSEGGSDASHAKVILPLYQIMRESLKHGLGKLMYMTVTGVMKAAGGLDKILKTMCLNLGQDMENNEIRKIPLHISETGSVHLVYQGKTLSISSLINKIVKDQKDGQSNQNSDPGAND